MPTSNSPPPPSGSNTSDSGGKKIPRSGSQSQTPRRGSLTSGRTTSSNAPTKTRPVRSRSGPRPSREMGQSSSTAATTSTRRTGSRALPGRSKSTNMNMSGQQGPSRRQVATTATTEDDDLFPTQTPQQRQTMRSMHNSTVALRFLDDDDDEEEFDLSGPNNLHSATQTQPPSTTNALMNRSAADFNMSQLQFPTVGGMFDDESMSDNVGSPISQKMPAETTAPSRFNALLPKRKEPEPNVFAIRQDLREVDQSVNLMDVGAGKYERGRGGRASKSKQRQSMVEIFLGEQTADPNNSKFRSLYNRDDRCWDRFVQMVTLFFKILCSWPVVILVTMLGSGIVLVPLLLDTIEAPPSTTESFTKPPSTELPEITEAPIVEDATTARLAPPNAGNDANTNPPLFSTDQVETRLQDLQVILAEEGLDTTTSEASLEALNWMAAYDPAMLPIANSVPVVERMATVALYFGMHPEATADSASLGLLPERQDERRLSSSKDWMGPANICEWEGLDCKAQHVVHLNVSRSHLQGRLPEELTLMKELIELDLSHNQIHGSLPASYPTKLSKLEYVRLQANQMDGSFPETIGDWTTVYHLDVSENQLTGSLPTTLAHLTQTRLLYLNRNKLEGSIPLQLGHLPKIEYLDLGHNQLTGELPMDLLSKLSTVVDLRLDNNALTGTIPPEIESLHRLEFLSLANNQLNGELPDVFDRLHYLVELDLPKNSFHGPLPESLGKATSLEKLLLEHNELVGPVPTSWQGLVALEKLRLDHNQLTGEMPLCSLPALAYLIRADCKSEVACHCCVCH